MLVLVYQAPRYVDNRIELPTEMKETWTALYTCTLFHPTQSTQQNNELKQRNIQYEKSRSQRVQYFFINQHLPHWVVHESFPNDETTAFGLECQHSPSINDRVLHPATIANCLLCTSRTTTVEYQVCRYLDKVDTMACSWPLSTHQQQPVTGLAYKANGHYMYWTKKVV